MDQRKGSRIPPLQEMCIDVILDNLNGLASIGDVPDYLLEKIINFCNAQQLLRIEESNKERNFNTEDLWRGFCNRELHIFSDSERHGKTWKQLYLDTLADYERKKASVGAKLRLMYEREDRMKKSKQIKVLGLGAVQQPTKRPKLAGSCDKHKFPRAPTSGMALSATRPKGKLFLKCLKEFKQMKKR